MADVYLHMKPAAQEELSARRKRIMTSRRLGIITTDQARAMLTAVNQEFMRVEFFDSDSDRNIGTKCDECQRLHIMPATVHHYRCPCSPNVERSSYLNQEILA